MSSVRKRGAGWEVKFQKNGLLEKPVYLTFIDKKVAEKMSAKIELLLEQGVVPDALSTRMFTNLGDLISEYRESSTCSKSDLELAPLLYPRVKHVRVSELNYAWVEAWVNLMISEGLAASSISKRIGSLARAVDWGARIGRMPQERNPVRMLPRGFATRQVSKDKLWAGERDRRLNSEAEEAALRKVLDEEEEFLFDFALETSMRLSEIIGLLWSQISLGERTIYLRSTKNGRKRQVPITRPLLALLKKRKPSANEGDAPVFSRWFGRPSWVVSCMFHNRVKKAGIVGLRFHDLRHEATSRLYERTRLTDVQIASITGHVELRMLRRYANLRASTLVEEMW